MNLKEGLDRKSVLTETLLKKYDVPAPRYTSYPTVPYWDHSLTTERWISHLNFCFKKNTPWSLYVHIPFCESLCTFCGCNTSITKNHRVEEPYVEKILNEWNLYLKKVPHLRKSPLVQIHYGGGTPTFLSPENLKKLTVGILKEANLTQGQFEASIEVDPRHTSFLHLQVLYDLGFNRISFGVQDFNSEVQELVNRVQSFELTQNLTHEARRVGYRSINFDLIYGLPRQSLELIKNTIKKTLILRPDRIALYSLAFVPWIKPQQRRFKESDLPKGLEKRKLYELSRTMLLKGGYKEIGMDHFALPHDDLALSQAQNTLHRNFMGYTSLSTDVLLGIGVSAISETFLSFHQNEKVLPLYRKKIESQKIPTLKGHVLTKEDRVQRRKILDLITQLKLDLTDESEENEIKTLFEPMIQDRLVEIKNSKLHVLDLGKPFLRNICMLMDKRLNMSLNTNKPRSKVFSQSI